MQQVGAFQRAVGPEATEGEAAEPAVSEHAELDHPRKVGRNAPLGQANDLDDAAAAFEPIEQGAERPPAIVAIETACQNQDLN